MTPGRMRKLTKKCAKAMAKGEWRRFQAQAEAHIHALIINQETAPHLEGRVRFKFHKEETL